MTTLLTTKEAARLLGVGTTSIKRWADAGELACVKTPGGHRRFPRDSVMAMLVGSGNVQAAQFDDTLDGWVQLLVYGLDAKGVFQRLLREHDKVGSWWQCADNLAPVLAEIGQRWERGEITILHEHVASQRLIRGINRCCEEISVPVDNEAAVLLTAEGDMHTLGLNLVELCLREGGWNTRWAGPSTPFTALERCVAAGECKLVAVSASHFSRDSMHLADQAAALSDLCRRYRVELLLGGKGAWPSSLSYGRRIDSFAELSVLLPSLATQPAKP